MASNLAQTSVWRDEVIRFQRSKVKVLVTSWHPINVKAIHFRNTLTERLQLRQKRLGPTSEAIRSKWFLARSHIIFPLLIQITEQL